MPAEWTGKIIGKMHVHGITNRQLAQKAGISEAYLSRILNSRYTSDNAEKRITAALDELIGKGEELE